MWVRQLATAGNGFVVKVARDADGNVFAAMGTSLVKLKPSGMVAWQVRAPATHLRIDARGDAIITGRDAPGLSWLAKRSRDGRLAWQKRLAGAASALILDPSGNIVIGDGKTIAKYASTGRLYWKRNQSITSEISTDADGDVYVMTGGNAFSKFSGGNGDLDWTIGIVRDEKERSVRFMRTEPSGESVFYGSGCCFGGSTS